ncbi:MAG: hypothetical protein ACUVS7_13205 [Bryobacteraceae bacterium]
MHRFLISAAVMILLPIPAPAQSSRKYTGPRPEKPDVPYLLHASRLIEVEKSVAAESKIKEGTLYTVPGAESPVKTPVPEPIFLFRAGKINPESLALYRMTPRGGSRTLLFPPEGKRRKEGPRPVFILVTMLEPGLYRVEVNEPLQDGEYCLSPQGSNDVFCFSEY